MAYLLSPPADAVPLDEFRAYPRTARPLLDYRQAVLRGPSLLAVTERELTAAYMSGSSSPCGGPAEDRSEPKLRRGRYSQ